MTREDKRAYNYARDRLANDDYPVYSDEYELELAYKAGIEDAKSHPHWISVEDELPTFFDIVLYCDEDGNYYTETDEIGQNVKITHWMHIPDCPPLQDFNNKLRAVLNGDNEKGGEE